MVIIHKFMLIDITTGLSHQLEALTYSTTTSSTITEPFILAYIDRKTNTGRANTLQTFSDLNRQVRSSNIFFKNEKGCQNASCLQNT